MKYHIFYTPAERYPKLHQTSCEGIDATCDRIESIEKKGGEIQAVFKGVEMKVCKDTTVTYDLKEVL